MHLKASIAFVSELHFSSLFPGEVRRGGRGKGGGGGKGKAASAAALT